jgi:hypothetical protein
MKTPPRLFRALVLPFLCGCRDDLTIVSDPDTPLELPPESSADAAAPSRPDSDLDAGAPRAEPADGAAGMDACRGPRAAIA